ncbi:BTB-domain-containing protein [Gigaspora margarita]|uniref:BTB-domain-containing protein n=1 Tax=Gigaspora margarita TaxID=4874 RepID=A0A8H4AQ23_GIGMA|nr:BTB-domain-containing protein [Gigaspora margarita]
MYKNFSENLSNNYIGLHNDKEDYNVIIKVGKSTNTKKFQVHSAILKSQSAYFRRKLGNTGKDYDIKTIYLNDVFA